MQPQSFSGSFGGQTWSNTTDVFQTVLTGSEMQHYYRIPKEPNSAGIYSSVRVTFRASSTVDLLLSAMLGFAVSLNDP